MCGIFGIVSSKEVNATHLVIGCLRKLDYRGYDSWGVAAFNGGVTLRKDIGPIPPDAEAKTPAVMSKLAVGHTRWATHGGVTVANAHPHVSMSKNVVLVHNGIVDNFEELKEELVAKGFKFESETDTEVIANLVEFELRSASCIEEAVRKAFLRLEGRNAIVVVNQKEGKMVAAKTGSPLIIGIAPDAKYIASDIPVLLPFTRDVVFLEDGDMVVASAKEIKIFDIETTRPKEFKVNAIQWSVEDAEKGEYSHFLIKEIFDQKWSVKNAVNHPKEAVLDMASLIRNAYGTYMVGCGTAAHACRTGTYAFSKIARRHINFCIGSEFPYFEFFLKEKSLLLAASQSGETADILDAVKAARNKKAYVASLVNVMGSTLIRMSDSHLLLNAGPEKAVLSSKAFTSKLAIFFLLAHTLNGEYSKGIERIHMVSDAINKWLTPSFVDSLRPIGKLLAARNDMYLLGRGLSYPIALEGAHKIKEASYIHAEGFAGGEPKHCEISLVSKGTPTVIISPNDETKHSIANNAMEFKARGAYIIGISNKNAPVFDTWIETPDLGDESAITNVIPMQILAYLTALELGHNPDKPRNLAKSLTVK